MFADKYLDLARQLKSGAMDEREFVRRVKQLPFMDLGDVKIDTHRAIQTNFAEVVFYPSKSLDHLKSIASSVGSPEETVLFPRITPEQAVTVGEILQDHVHFPKARLLGSIPPPEGTIPGVAVVSAGTSDIPVAEEATVTAEYLGCSVNRLFDVGVAKIHRLFEHLPMLQDPKVIVVVAGMEGALPTVVGGLVSCPVIAVPTSVGYGANLQGLAPLVDHVEFPRPWHLGGQHRQRNRRRFLRRPDSPSVTSPRRLRLCPEEVKRPDTPKTPSRTRWDTQTRGGFDVILHAGQPLSEAT